ncbi:MAG: hypothetical protein WD080_06525 [Egibacteraceae bacterium]
MMTIRVLVADDQDIVRAGLTMILDAQPGIAVVGQAADGRRTGPRPAQPIEPLTAREKEVLIASLMRKLHARNRVEIAMWVYETGRIKT